MAKFKDLSLDLETGEHIDFDDADLIKMGYDGAELYINSTISGVRAAQPYQMVRYDQLTEVSGILDDKFVWRDGSKKLTGDWITGSGIEVPWLQFELENPVPPHSEGLLHWNSDDGTLDLDMPGGEVHLQIGQEQLVRVLNKSGVQIDNGSVVYISGAQGDRPTVELAQANSIITTGAIGMATEDIADDALGYVTTAGTVRDLDTSGIPAGSLIYLSGDTAGAFTDIRPTSPDYKVLLGYVTREHANVGTVIIKPIITPRMMSLSDVLRETPTQDGEFLAWSTANSRFELTTSSGAGDIDHGSLLGLDGDDHLQYILVDGSRGFTGTVSGVDPTESYHLTTKFYVDDLVNTTSGNIVDQIITDHGELIGLSDDDHLQYVPRDGSRGFTGTVSGIDPTESYHLTTRWYVDDLVNTTSGNIVDQIVSDHGDLTGLDGDDHLQYVPRDGSRGFTSTVSGVYPIELYDLVTLEALTDYVVEHTFGDYFEYAIDEAISSTNSTTYVQKLRLTTSGIPEGSYRVGWSFEWRISKQNETFFYRIQLDDTTSLNENNKSPFVDVNEYQLISNFYYFPTLASGIHTIDIDYHSSSAGATAYISEARIEFWGVA